MPISKDQTKPGAWRALKVAIKPTIPLKSNSHPTRISAAIVATCGTTIAANPSIKRTIPSVRKSCQCLRKELATVASMRYAVVVFVVIRALLMKKTTGRWGGSKALLSDFRITDIFPKTHDHGKAGIYCLVRLKNFHSQNKEKSGVSRAVSGICTTL